MSRQAHDFNLDIKNEAHGAMIISRGDAAKVCNRYYIVVTKMLNSY